MKKSKPPKPTITQKGQGTSNTKKPLPQLKRKISVHFSIGSRRNSQASLGFGRNIPQLSGPVPATANSEISTASEEATKTIKFVYSESIERGFRHAYMCPDFGPKSARPPQPYIEVMELAQMYKDYEYVKALLHRKAAYLDKLQEEMELDDQVPLTGRSSLYKGLFYNRGPGFRKESSRSTIMISRASMNSQRGHYGRLPSILSSQTGTMSSRQESSISSGETLGEVGDRMTSLSGTTHSIRTNIDSES